MNWRRVKGLKRIAFSQSISESRRAWARTQLAKVGIDCAHSANAVRWPSDDPTYDPGETGWITRSQWRYTASGPRRDWVCQVIARRGPWHVLVSWHDGSCSIVPRRSVRRIHGDTGDPVVSWSAECRSRGKARAEARARRRAGLPTDPARIEPETLTDHLTGPFNGQDGDMVTSAEAEAAEAEYIDELFEQTDKDP